jgi:hypothetical protein
MKSRTRVAAPLAVSIVALVALLAGTFAFGGCASGASPVTSGGPSVTAEASLTIPFDNAAQSYVDVYLIGQLRQWRLGRVEPGAHAILRIPESALANTPEFVRLAVLEGALLSLEPARDPGAVLTLAQPRSQLTAQRWTFSTIQSASLQIVGAPR